MYIVSAEASSASGRHLRRDDTSFDLHSSSLLEDKTHGKLQSAGWVGTDSLAEERRGHDPHEILLVDVIEEVKGISGQFKFPFAVVTS